MSNEKKVTRNVASDIKRKLTLTDFLTKYPETAPNRHSAGRIGKFRVELWSD